MPVMIRPATLADDTAIKEMVRAERLDPTSLKWENFLVAVADERIVGIGQLRQHGGCQELGSLVTLPEYRGQGVASQLMAALEARASRPLYLFCPDYRESFYEQHGYVRVNRRDMPRCLGFKGKVAMFMQMLGIPVRLMRKD
jgi:amino-acid N-acetyltransferase